MKFNLRAVAVACIAMALALPAQAKPPMEAFGDVPAVRSANLSPDGTKMVFISRLDGKDYLTLYDFATGEGVPLASTTEIRARYAYFAGPDHVVLIASDQVRMEFFRRRARNLGRLLLQSQDKEARPAAEEHGHRLPGSERVRKRHRRRSGRQACLHAHLHGRDQQRPDL